MSGTYTRSEESKSHQILKVTELGHKLKLLSCKRVELDIETAEKILGLKEFVGDRPLRDAHVDYLIMSMKRGTFRPELVKIISCSFNGEEFRMNGQHTCWARIHMPANYSCTVEWVRYEAASEDDMRTLYSSIDRNSPRTKANVLTSYLAGTKEFSDIKSTTLRLLPFGFAMYKWPSGHERRQYDGDAMAFLMRTTEYDLSIKVASFLDTMSPRGNRHMFRAPVVAAMYMTFAKVPQIAKEFWGPVGDGTGFEKQSDPRNRLRTELLQSAVESGEGARSDKRRITGELMLRLCIAAWNAYREGRPLQFVRATEKGKRSALK